MVWGSISGSPIWWRCQRARLSPASGLRGVTLRLSAALSGRSLVANADQGADARRLSLWLVTANVRRTAGVTRHINSRRLVDAHDLIAIQGLEVSRMVRSARGTPEKPGRNVRQKAGLNRSIMDWAVDLDPDARLQGGRCR